jgi:hypothetical protein
MVKKGPSLRKQYQKLMVKDKEELTDEINNVREERKEIARANPKAVQRDVNAAFDMMEKDVSHRCHMR